MFNLERVGDKSLLKENENPCDFCLYKNEGLCRPCEDCRDYDNFCDRRFDVSKD